MIYRCPKDSELSAWLRAVPDSVPLDCVLYLFYYSFYIKDSAQLDPSVSDVRYCATQRWSGQCHFCSKFFFYLLVAALVFIMLIIQTIADFFYVELISFEIIRIRKYNKPDPGSLFLPKFCRLSASFCWLTIFQINRKEMLKMCHFCGCREKILHILWLFLSFFYVYRAEIIILNHI